MVLLVGTTLVSTDSTGEVREPRILVDSQGNVHILWFDSSLLEGKGGALYDLAYRGLSNGVWSSTDFLTTDYESTIWVYAAGLEDDDSLHVAWVDYIDDGTYSIQNISHYTKQGDSWQHRGSQNVDIVDEDALVFDGVRTLTFDSQGGLHAIVSYRTQDQTLFPSVFEHRYLTKTDDAWVDKGSIPVTLNSDLFHCDLVIDSEGRPHIVYPTHYSHNNRIIYQTKDLGEWTDPKSLDTGFSDTTWNPKIAVHQDGTVHVIWETRSDMLGAGDDIDVFHRVKINGDWTSTQLVTTESTKESTMASIALDEQGNAHVVWRDSTNYGGSGSDTDIFYKKWIQGEWGETEVVSKGSRGNDYNPSIAVDAYGNVHVAWCGDHISTGYGIFYNCKPIGGEWE